MNQDCIFCRIIEGSAKAQIVYQDAALVVFKDLRPKAPVHLLLVPRKHIPTLLDLETGDESLIGSIFQAASRVAREQGLAEKGFRVVVNCGEQAGQTVFHLHFHLMGGRSLAWPPG
ncbi:MAG: histidine triad nucleotide-binding protein [Candidatus Binatia bacterium]